VTEGPGAAVALSPSSVSGVATYGVAASVTQNGHSRFSGAEDGIRTRDPLLGKLAICQLRSVEPPSNM
jgi:hypothetical protein